MSRNTKSVSCYAAIENWEYKKLNKIGSGATAQVYLAEHPDHKKVSIKMIENSFIKTKSGSKLIDN